MIGNFEAEKLSFLVKKFEEYGGCGVFNSGYCLGGIVTILPTVSRHFNFMEPFIINL